MTTLTLYFKESLPIKERCDLEILPKTEIKQKKVFIVLSYCRPNLENCVFIEYLSSLENIYDVTYESIREENPMVSMNPYVKKIPWYLFLWRCQRKVSIILGRRFWKSPGAFI